MKLPCLSIFFILVIIHKGYCQKQRIFKQGIYTSWEQLLSNTPQHPLPVKIQYKKIRTYNIVDEIHRMAVIEISKQKAKELGEVFAFSNGKELFINENGPNLSSGPFFTVVEMHGENYGVYNDLFSIGLNRKIGVGNFPMYCKVSGTNIINFSKQSITKVKGRNSLKKLIASDQELLKEFQSEDDKNSMIKLYVIQYLLRK